MSTPELRQRRGLEKELEKKSKISSVGSVDKELFSLHGIMRWFWEEGKEMTLPMVPIGGTEEEKLAHPVVRYNPLYWGMFLFNGASVTGGRFVHALFGQGGKVRSDETEVEHEVRVQWVYANDVLYFWSLLMDIVSLASEIDLLAFHKHVGEAHVGALSTIVATVLLAVTVGGNIAFLHAMRTRSQTGVRAAVAGNAGFAVILLSFMGCSIYKRAMKGTLWKLLSWSKAFAMGSRAMTIVFAFMAIPSYGKLWKAYDSQPIRVLDVVSVTIQFSFMVFLSTCYMLDHHAVWEAFG